MILPVYAPSSIYAHAVFYQLTNPLDVITTPYVRELCWPFFGGDPRFHQGFIAAVQNSVKFEYITYGFARYQKPSTSKQENHSHNHRRLKAWKAISVPRETCESIFRFYYDQTPDLPMCATRNFGNASGLFTSNSIKEFDIPKNHGDDHETGDEDEDEDDFSCLGSGSSNMAVVGNTWFSAPQINLVPEARNMKCGKSTNYFMYVWFLTKDIQRDFHWVYKFFE